MSHALREHRPVDIELDLKPPLDPHFLPAALWNRAFREACSADPGAEELVIALSRPDGTVFTHRTRTLPHEGANVARNERYVERVVKSLLWLKGGSRITIGGNPALGARIAQVYHPEGPRSFDHDLLGRRIFRQPMAVVSCSVEEVPAAHEEAVSLGRHLEGCRIGFDLGGSDRKAAALIDGEVVFSEEIAWDPYFQKDPAYHFQGIQDSLTRAAAHLPRVDAIGGSAAGVYVDNEPRVASLFRGLSEEDFERHARPLFHRLRKEWGGVPFEVVNDGEVTALAGSLSLKANAVLGIAMGTSQAAGYCNADGCITTWLNELAFAPIDLQDDAPADEWSGDVGCGVQYFSQQGVARLAARAGIDLPSDMPLAERLVEVQRRMAADDPRARRIYQTIGVWLGHAIATYAEYYEIRHLLLLGRVMSGEGGAILLRQAEAVLEETYPGLREQVRLSMPDETMRRHGQAIAAASLPRLAAQAEGRGGCS